MSIKAYNPTTPSLRGMTKLDTSHLTKKRPEKSLTTPLKKTGGRNHRGIITAQHIGGGAKRLYRVIDWKRNDKDGVPAKVIAIEYDPNRSANIALLQYVDGVKRYILAVDGLKVGMILNSGADADPEIGNCMPLENIPAGMTVCAVEMQPGQGAKMARSAGMGITLMAKEGSHAILLMPSTEMRRVQITCRATIGKIGNMDHGMVKVGKAGRNRHKGIRPHVRGSCKNPVDHPLGGGEGRHAGGKHFCSPSGIYARGGHTRNPRARSDSLIISRRKKKNR